MPSEVSKLSGSDGKRSTPVISIPRLPLANSVSRRLAHFTSDGSPSLLPRTPRPAATQHTPRVVKETDDEEERRQRRLQKNLCTMLSPGCHTPKGSSSSARVDRSRAVESSATSLSNAQLTEHYANCMKLSSQNKISHKNAFGLHLIDHMLRLLRMRGEMSNFQVASSTLDASTKIYAGRVDNIYQDMLKVLGGLGGKGNEQGKEPENPEEAGETEEGEEAQGKKAGKRKSKRSNAAPGLMIEKDPKNLTASFDFESRVDPLFQKTAAAFDEGGVEGLLMNNLTVQDDSCSLNLDASQPPVTSDHPVKGIPVKIDESWLDLDAIMSSQICPTFANFKFNCTDTGRDMNLADVQSMEVGGEGRSGGVGQAADFTMLDCPPAAPGESAADDDDGFGDAPAMDANTEEGFTMATHGDTTVLGVCNDNKVAQFAPAPALGVVSERPAAPGLVGDLCLTDLIAPSDYSYFNPAVIASWAGPQHWKLRPRNALKKPEEKESKAVPRKKKNVFKVDYSKTSSKSLFAAAKASTQLSKAALKKLDSSHMTLPSDINKDPDILTTLFSQPKWKIRRQKKKSAKVVDDNDDMGGDWYDYENANDQLNYCPPVDNGEDSDDEGGMDETAAGFYCNNSEGYMNETAPPPGGGGPLGDDGASSIADGVEMEGEGLNLVAQPRKVEQVMVDYARSSKKIDVKKLKSKMWEVISHPREETDAATQPSLDDGGDDDDVMAHSEGDPPASAAEGVGFSSMYSDLPSVVSNTMAENLSVPICIVCLLHLANEKELKLTHRTDLSDFNIFTS